jgi:uncharacterized protein (TIGR01777 family)
MVGTALTKLLLAGGHRVTGLTRKPSEADPGRTARVRWEPESGTLHTGDVDGHDVAVHLAGENIAAGPWTATRKARIRDSRVRGTDLLCRTLAAAENGPRVLVCASAVGFYGDRGDTSVDESSRPGEGFLAQTCVEWEAAAAPARAAEIRVVHLRIGMVLSPAGGALSRMLPQWRLGLGGPLGGGRQFWSWISLDDLVSVILHAAIVEGLEGPVNAAARRDGRRDVARRRERRPPETPGDRFRVETPGIGGRPTARPGPTPRDGRMSRGLATGRPIRIGISSCLLGQKVRFDGGH